MVSKCHNPGCSKKFRYFGDGKLFEFTAASVSQSSQLFWLCDVCVQTHTLERGNDGEVRLIAKSSSEKTEAQAKRFRKAG